MKNYKIITSTTPVGLEKEMNKLAEEGWKPVNISVGTGAVSIFVVLMEK